MCFPKEKITLKTIFLLLFFSILFSASGVFAQLPAEDLPIDPNSLKNASPSDLQSFLRDNNGQEKKAGDDIHKNLEELRNKNIIVKATFDDDGNASSWSSSGSS